VPIDARGFGPRPNHFETILKMSRLPASSHPRWMPFVRGDLYRLKAPKGPRGPEQAGARFVVVLQSDDLPLSTWIVAPTSTGRREASFRPEININGAKTRVLVERLTVIDPEIRLGEFVGRLSGPEMRAVDAALLAVLALD
jgi:mRNA interferase MazF